MSSPFPTPAARVGLPVLIDPAQAPDPGRSRPEVPVRGAGLFEALERPLVWLEQGSRRLVPDAWNPLLNAGAWATALLLIACATGALLLFWYQPSVHLAHESMRAIEAGVLSQVVRATHRYSSDLCAALVAWHALRLTLARRFTGARWLAWVTGVLGLGLLWAVGWTGYWLVWDEAARQVALVSARALDVLPIFGDPLSREFLADATINSLFFFIIFFFHMLVPLGLGVALWLHLARLQRPVFLTPWRVTAALVGALGVLSVVAWPVADAPARMAVLPARVTLDAWYLLPLPLLERLSGGAMVAGFLALGVVGFAVPWLLGREKNRPATVVEARCNACEQCVIDCPYEAIELVPRTDGRAFPTTARVIESRCVGCGICTGSCASAGSGLPHFELLLERARLEAWVAEAGAEAVLFLCRDAAPAGFAVDDATGRCAALPGYRVRLVPCAGWVQAITVERLLRKGAPGVLIVGCAGSCRFREGMTWTKARLFEGRSPELPARVDRSRVRLLELTRLEPARLKAEAAAFLAGRAPPPQGRAPAWVGAAVTTLGLAAVTVFPSHLPWTPPRPSTPLLAVGFKHPGAVEQACRTRTPEELAALPAHMRQATVCERQRYPVRVEVRVDHEVVASRSYEPGGVWGDGASVGVLEVAVPEGRHQVEVRLGDTGDPRQWPWRDAREVDFRVGERPAVVFDRVAGFTWHLAPTVTCASCPPTQAESPSPP